MESRAGCSIMPLASGVHAEPARGWAYPERDWGSREQGRVCPFAIISEEEQ